MVNPPPIFDTPLAIPTDACLNGFARVSIYINIISINQKSNETRKKKKN
jgi:hypothetical protein